LTLPISRHRVQYQAITPIKLPEYAGSALRGAFGHALKSIACMTAARNRGVCCCVPATSCAYRQLFDPPMQQVQHSNQQDIPAPIAIEPVLGGVVLQAGEHGYFDVVLMGQFAHQQQMIIQLAWQRALHDGIGVTDPQGRRGQAMLLGMSLLNQPAIDIPANPRHAHLQLISPMRLQHYGNWITAEHLTAPILLKAVLRRCQMMVQLYRVQQAEPIESEPQFDATQFDQVGLERRVKWTQWTRYSNRQKREMTLGGLVGRVYLTDIPDEIWPYLYLGQWLHAGKNSIFGLGHYQIVEQAWQPHLIKSNQPTTTSTVQPLPAVSAAMDLTQSTTLRKTA
jgi:hypothetical protein